MSDFADRPLVAGSLLGLRSFKVTGEGVLTGVVHQDEWVSGENVARCSGMTAEMVKMSYAFAQCSFNMAITISKITGKVCLQKRPKPPRRPELSDHQAGRLGCTCGFYAYFDGGDNPHHSDGQILGIVEGYGAVTVGSRGFRAEKARIRALVIEPQLSPVVLTARMYPEAAIFRTVDQALTEFPLAQLAAGTR